MKIIIEPRRLFRMARSSSASLRAAAPWQARSTSDRKRVGIILTGGNVDLDAFPWNL
jgi:hypothetical protein